MTLAVLALLAQLSGVIWHFWLGSLAPGMEAHTVRLGRVFVLSFFWLAHSVLPLILGGVLGVVLQAGLPLLHQGPELALVEMWSDKLTNQGVERRGCNALFQLNKENTNEGKDIQYMGS